MTYSTLSLGSKAERNPNKLSVIVSLFKAKIIRAPIDQVTVEICVCYCVIVIVFVIVLTRNVSVFICTCVCVGDTRHNLSNNKLICITL